jgi:glycosyltransferase involved in cell wall biosynthesis
MDITVAICTWNRARLLDATLEQLRRLRVPGGVSWELLVVNNRCTDNTDAVIRKHEPHLPLRRLFEPRQGHSNARNCAVAAMRGELLIWTDDDVLVDEGWLQAYWDAVKQYPHAAYFGGTVDPLYETEPPKWVHEQRQLVEGPLAIRRLGSEVRVLEKDEYPFGANMAFRMSRLPRLEFDPRLGRMGNAMISGDDTQVIDQLKSQNIPGIWVGTARVRHFVPCERLTTRYVWNFWAGIGATDTRRYGLPPGKYVLNMPRWMIRQYMLERWRLLKASFRRDRRWADAFRRAAYTWGILRESAQQRSGQPA